MADTTGVSSGTEPTSVEPSTGAGVYPADVQKAIDEANARVAKAEAERKKANEEAASYRIKEKEAADKKAIENGEAVRLAEERLARVNELEAKTKTYEDELSVIKTARRNELLGRLPADKAKNYENVELSVLETITKDFAAAPPPGNSQGSDRGAAANGQNGANKKELPLVPFAGSDAPSIKILADILNN